MRVVTKEVQLHAFSIPGHRLPTFSKGKIKTVYNKWGCKIARYLVFTEIDQITFYKPATPFEKLYNTWEFKEKTVYVTNYVKLKL